MKITLKRKTADAETMGETIRQQKARIEELKRENADLLFTLDEYTKKENSILESIGYLEEKKREQTESLNKKYAAELEKLDFFEAKWLGIVNNSDDPALNASVAHTRETLRACRDEILRTTRRELKISKIRTAPEEDYRSETARLGAISKDAGFDPDAGFTPAEYLKYRREVKNAIAEDGNDLPQAAPPDRASNRGETDARRAPDSNPEVKFERFRSRFQTDDSDVGAPQADLTETPARETSYDTADRAARTGEPETSRYAETSYGTTDRAARAGEPETSRRDDFPPAPRRDEFPATPVSEPPEQVSPKKMSDKEIMSLLERLSV